MVTVARTPRQLHTRPPQHQAESTSGPHHVSWGEDDTPEPDVTGACCHHPRSPPDWGNGRVGWAMFSSEDWRSTFLLESVFCEKINKKIHFENMAFCGGFSGSGGAVQWAGGQCVADAAVVRAHVSVSRGSSWRIVGRGTPKPKSVRGVRSFCSGPATTTSSS